MSLRQSLHELFSSLHDIADRNEDFTETEPQEIIHWTLHHFYIWGQPIDRLPSCYGLMNRQGNINVGQAMALFLSKAPQQAVDEGYVQPGQRLAIMMEKRFTSEGKAPYDVLDLLGEPVEPLCPDGPPPDFIDIYAGPDYPTVEEES